MGFRKRGAINLEGKWEFYWKKIIRPNQTNLFSEEKISDYFEFPSSWSGRFLDNETVNGNGYATFRMKVLLPNKIGKKTK